MFHEKFFQGNYECLSQQTNNVHGLFSILLAILSQTHFQILTLSKTINFIVNNSVLQSIYQSQNTN